MHILVERFAFAECPQVVETVQLVFPSVGLHVCIALPVCVTKSLLEVSCWIYCLPESAFGRCEMYLNSCGWIAE